MFHVKFVTKSTNVFQLQNQVFLCPPHEMLALACMVHVCSLIHLTLNSKLYWYLFMGLVTFQFNFSHNLSSQQSLIIEFMMITQSVPTHNNNHSGYSCLVNFISPIKSPMLLSPRALRMMIKYFKTIWHVTTHGSVSKCVLAKLDYTAVEPINRFVYQ